MRVRLPPATSMILSLRTEAARSPHEGSSNTSPGCAALECGWPLTPLDAFCLAWRSEPLEGIYLRKAVGWWVPVVTDFSSWRNKARDIYCICRRDCHVQTKLPVARKAGKNCVLAVARSRAEALSSPDYPSVERLAAIATLHQWTGSDLIIFVKAVGRDRLHCQA